MIRAGSSTVAATWGLAIVVASLIALRLLIDHGPGQSIALAWPSASIVGFRVTSIVLDVAIGVALAVSGVLLQALLRNPLASPFILGLSSGAAVGVMLAMYIGVATGLTIASGAMYTIPALLGALIVLGIVFLLGRRRGVLDPLSLVLVGVVVSAMCAAFLMILELLVPNRLTGDLLSWMMGRIDQGVGQASLWILSGIVVVGSVIAWAAGRSIDVATFSDAEAHSMGLAVGRFRVALFVVAGVLAASTVTVAGPIGFVGLIAPHVARLLVGAKHARLIPVAALVGAGLLLAADTASQAIVLPSAGRIPVGVFTALVGGPLFILLLRSGRGIDE